MRLFAIINDKDWAARLIIEDDGRAILVYSHGRYLSEITLEDVMNHPETFSEI